MRILAFILSVAFAFQSSLIFAHSKGNVAIVIDDIGNSQADLKALDLPYSVTLSILPYTPHAKQIAQQANLQNREVLLHIPMQAKASNHLLGKGALLLNMKEAQFKTVLQHSIQMIPSATGINNHMGSDMTEHITQMHWTMDVLKMQGLYFLDSRTTSQSVAEYSARISGVPTLRRHVFLDNIKTNQAMEKQFQLAIKLAKKNKSVVIIAHPYPSTIKYLQHRLNTEKNSSIQFVSLNRLLSSSERIALSKIKSQLLHAKIDNNSSKQTQ